MKITLTCNRLDGGDEGDIDIKIDTNSRDGERKLDEGEQRVDLIVVLIMAILSLSDEFGFTGDDIKDLLDAVVESWDGRVVDETDAERKQRISEDLMGLFYKKHKDVN